MAANASKAQVDRVYRDRQVMRASMKLEGEALQRHIGRKAATFEHRNSKRLKTRGAKKAHALKDW